MSAHRPIRIVRALLAVPVLVVAGLLPAAPGGAAAASAADSGDVPARPSPPVPGPGAPLPGGAVNLQVSPELSESRAGVPVVLTARLYHDLPAPVAVVFELVEIGNRPRAERHRAEPELARCTADPAARSCSVSFVRPRAALAHVTGWIDADGGGPDREEARLASFSRPPLLEADCTLDDGEPLDAGCRNENASDVAPGDAEPDGTDVVLVAWTGVAEGNLDCDDRGGPDGTELERRAPDDRTVVYACRVTERATGEPMAGAPIAAEIMGGPFDPDGGARYPADYGNGLADDGGSRRLCTTTAPLGHCRFELTVPGSGPGAAFLCLWMDDNNDAHFGGSEGDGGGCARERRDEPEHNDATDAVEIVFR